MSSFVRHVAAALLQKRPGHCFMLSRLNSSSSSLAEKKTKKNDGENVTSEEKKTKEFTNVDGLKEFFDSPETFGAIEVKHGRSWTVEELRIKSNSDLHKLWYVLLKERNLLLTLEAAAEAEVEAMPSPERIDKVNESMANLEKVVRERNEAYFQLEVGETGERPTDVKPDWMGLVRKTRLTEHWIPQRYNTSYNKLNPLPFNDKNQKWFLQHYNELQERKKVELIINSNYRYFIIGHKQN